MLVLKRGYAWLSYRWENNGCLLWPRWCLGPFDLQAGYASIGIHFTCSSFFPNMQTICKILKKWTPWLSKAQFTWNHLKFSPRLISTLRLPPGQILPPTQQEQLYQLAIAGLCYHLKSRLKSFAFPHFNGMLFNHQRGTCHDPTVQ